MRGGSVSGVRKAIARMALAVVLEGQLRVSIADDALGDHVEAAVEGRGRKPLSPDLGAQRRAQFERQLAAPELAVAVLSLRRERRRRQPLARDRLEGLGEAGEGVGRDRQARGKARGRRSASPCPGARLATRSSASRRWNPAIDRPEPLSSPSPLCANTMTGTVKAVLEPRRDDADHALVPLRTVHAQRVRVGAGERLGDLDLGQRLLPASTPRCRGARGSAGRARARAAAPRPRFPRAGSECRPTCRPADRRR